MVYDKPSFIASFEADRPDETLVEIRHIQIVDINTPFEGRRVNEFIIADIDTHMAQPASCIEEEKISGDQFTPFHSQCHQGLFKGGSGKIDVEELIDFFHKSRTVDPCNRSPPNGRAHRGSLSPH